MYSSTTQTPIDIHCSKLVDWLVQRRHCKRDWGENLAIIRRKIRTALRDMPENEELKQLLIGSKLDYFKSKRILELLKMTEADSKNIFGFYSSQRMKDWQDIIYSYERDYIYLAEVATDLIRETNYEVPGIRKVINKLSKEKEELEKERSNLLRRAQHFNSEYQKMAQSYGIKGVDIGRELEDQSKCLKEVMNVIVTLSKELESGLDFYRNYSKLTTKQDSSKFLPLLQYIIHNGNTTVYEWKYGEAPEKVEVAETLSSTAVNPSPSEIELIDDEIDFGEDPPSSESSSGFVHVTSSDAGNGSGEDTFIKVEEEESQSSRDNNNKIARGNEAKLVLEFRKSRCQYLNNLYELEAFLIQVNDELTTNTDKSSSFFGDDSSRTYQYNSEELNQMIAKIRQVLSIMNSDKNRIQFQMTDSSAFLDSVKEKFAKKSQQAYDSNVKADLLDERIKDIDIQKKESEIHLKKCIISAKELQEKVETSLRDLYKGRPINIMGCVS